MLVRTHQDRGPICKAIIAITCCSISTQTGDFCSEGDDGYSSGRLIPRDRGR
jgi:hypothetical protein